MEAFVHSKPYDRELPTWGANLTSLPIRLSKHSRAANQVSQKLIDTWKLAGLPTQSVDGEDYLGNASVYHGISVCIPEAPPECIPTAVKLLDALCVFDSSRDQQACQTPNFSRREKWAMVKIATSVLVRNPFSLAGLVRSSIIYFRSLQSFSPVFPAEQHSFAELYPIRLYDVPSFLIMPSLAVVLGLKLSTKDAAFLRCLDVASTAAMALNNDIISWPKEMNERTSSKREPCSAMTIFLRQPSCDERQALLWCRRKLMQFEMKAALLVDELLANPSVSSNVKKMAQSYLLLIAGLAAWPCVCKRYGRKGPATELVREILEIPLPCIALDDAFDEDFESIVNGYGSLYRRYFK